MNNREKGAAFAKKVRRYLENSGCVLMPEYSVAVRLGTRQHKQHRFDFGNASLLVECKYYDWTSGGNRPSAKISTLNESMLYFVAAPTQFRKMLFVAQTTGIGERNETLAEYYVRRYSNLIPGDVEVWELNDKKLIARRVI